MKYSATLDRLADLGGAKWQVHYAARSRAAAGEDIVELTIGEPDAPTPPELIDVAVTALQSQRTGYSNGRGEPNLRAALAERYSRSSGRAIGTDQVLCFPGTQTALFAVMLGLCEPGVDVLVGDPMYATYEGVIRATGANMVSVPLRPELGFRLQAEDIARRLTPRSRVVLLNTPHNPTGAILSPADIADICALAEANDLWIVCDEVYEEFVFPGAVFSSPLSLVRFAERVIVASSISKSHAAPGFRSGWMVGPASFVERLLPLSETMLFGNQPFIADMTEAAIRSPSSIAAGMCQRFAARAALLKSRLEGETTLRVHVPEAGMFALVDVSATGLAGEEYAARLLDEAGVAVMPGRSFGEALEHWVRVALTAEDARFTEGCDRIVAHARARVGTRA